MFSSRATISTSLPLSPFSFIHFHLLLRTLARVRESDSTTHAKRRCFDFHCSSTGTTAISFFSTFYEDLIIFFPRSPHAFAHFAMTGFNGTFFCILMPTREFSFSTSFCTASEWVREKERESLNDLTLLLMIKLLWHSPRSRLLLARKTDFLSPPPPTALLIWDWSEVSVNYKNMRLNLSRIFTHTHLCHCVCTFFSWMKILSDRFFFIIFYF